MRFLSWCGMPLQGLCVGVIMECAPLQGLLFDSLDHVARDEELDDLTIALDWGSHDGGEHVGSRGGAVRTREVVTCPVLGFILRAAERVAGAALTVVVDENVPVQVIGSGRDGDACDVLVGDFCEVHS